MKVTQTVQILGCKGFKGNIEGTNYDSTTLYVVMPVSEKAGTEAGFNVSAMKWARKRNSRK